MEVKGRQAQITAKVVEYLNQYQQVQNLTVQTAGKPAVQAALASTQAQLGNYQWARVFFNKRWQQVLQTIQNGAWVACQGTCASGYTTLNTTLAAQQAELAAFTPIETQLAAAQAAQTASLNQIIALNTQISTLQGRSLASANPALKNSFNAARTCAQLEAMSVFSETAMRIVGDVYARYDKAVTDAERALVRAKGTADEAAAKATLAAAEAAKAGIETERALAHGLVGALTAALGGANPASGFIGGTTAKLVTTEMDKLLATSDWAIKNPTAANLVKTLSATAAGSIVGGTTGGFVASQGDRFNRQLHWQERELIRRLAKDKAKQECQGNPQCNESQRAIVWADMLERTAEGLTDDAEFAKNMQYLGGLLQTANIPNSAGSTGSVEGYLSQMQTALAILSPYMGKPITVNGKSVTYDGTTQTYFSATPEQRTNRYINYFLDDPGSIVPGMELRDEKRLETFSVVNGQAQPQAVLEELLLGGKVAELSAKAVTRLLGSLDVALAGRVAATNSGNISARQITESGLSVRLSATEIKTITQIDNMTSTAIQGEAREYVANSYFARNGFTPLEGKCGSGNCFDGVYVKGDKVYINEVKPLNSNGTIKLSGGSGTGLPTQMTDDWIRSRAGELAKGTLEQRATAQTIFKAFEDKTLVRVVSGVNSNGMTIVKLQ